MLYRYELMILDVVKNRFSEEITMKEKVFELYENDNLAVEIAMKAGSEDDGEFVDIPVKNIINAARVNGAMDALKIIQETLLDYLDDNDINPDTADPELKKIVGLIFKNSINIKDDCKKKLEETYDFNIESDEISVKVPRHRIIKGECII